MITLFPLVFKRMHKQSYGFINKTSRLHKKRKSSYTNNHPLHRATVDRHGKSNKYK